MSKQQIGVTPITVPTVARLSDPPTDQVEFLVVGNLRTYKGPAAFNGRRAWLRLTAYQAEVLVRELAAKLGLEVTP